MASWKRSAVSSLLFVSPKGLDSLVIFLTAHELSEDPDDWFAASLAMPFTIYYRTHRLIKVFLVADPFCLYTDNPRFSSSGYASATGKIACRRSRGA